MAYGKKPVYHFDSKASTGLDKIPNNKMVFVEGDNTLYATETKSNFNISSGTTVQDAIDEGFLLPLAGGADQFLDLKDTPTNYIGQQGQLVKVNATQDGLIFGDPSGTSVSWGDIQGVMSNQTDLSNALDDASNVQSDWNVSDRYSDAYIKNKPNGGGADKFTELTDTPSNYSGQQGKLIKVNATETGLIYGSPAGVTVEWGDIGGDIDNQTDLKQSDWNQNNSNEFDYIKNKPNVGGGGAESLDDLDDVNIGSLSSSTWSVLAHPGLGASPSGIFSSVSINIMPWLLQDNDGSVSITGTVARLRVDGETTLNEKVHINDAVIVEEDSTFEKKLSVDGFFAVGGRSQFNGDVQMFACGMNFDSGGSISLDAGSISLDTGSISLDAGSISLYGNSISTGIQKNGYGIYTTGKGHFTEGVDAFTGSHIILTEEEDIAAVGDLISVIDNINIDINNTVCFGVTTTSSKDKTVIGVMKEDVPVKAKDDPMKVYKGFLANNYSEKYLYLVNSLGDGQINVCEAAGDIEIGDYLTSSNVLGKAQKQSDDVLHNYTVAKSLQDVDWSQETVGVDGCFSFSGVKCKMVGCTYHCG